MRTFCFAIVVVSLCAFHWPLPARADFDISPRVLNGRLATFGYSDDDTSETPSEERVFDFAFDPVIDANYTQDPGIHALSTGFVQANPSANLVASGLPNGSYISFDILSNLKYWNGSGPVSFGPVPGGETLKLYTDDVPATTTVVGSGPGFYAGFVVGNAVGTGEQNISYGDEGFHHHFNSLMQPGTGPGDPADPTDGVYAMLMQLHLLQLSNNQFTPYPGIDSSLPFYVLYDHGAPDGAIDDAVAYAQTLVPEPSACVLAGLGGVLLFGRRSRGRRKFSAGKR